jgi:hypothetical protein
MHGSHRSHFSSAFIVLLTHRGPGVWQIFIYRGVGAPNVPFAPAVPWAKAGPGDTYNRTCNAHTCAMSADSIPPRWRLRWSSG